MRTRPHPAVVALATAALLLAAGAAQAAPGGTDPATALSVGEQAYDYGIPLLESLRVRREMSRVTCADNEGHAPVNTFSHVRQFPDATFRTVVAPNTDTLYSISHLDLGAGPLVLRYPDMGSRYFSFAMLDPYTNVIAIPGVREDGSRAGTVVVRWAGAPGKTAPPAGARVVSAPNRHVWVIGRTLAGDAADQRRAFATMQRYRLTRLDGTRIAAPPACAKPVRQSFPTPKDGKAFVAALNAALKADPPPRRDAALLARLRPYGIGAGLSPDKAGLDPVTLAALYRGVSNEAALLPQKAKVDAAAMAVQHKGWFEPPANIGRYGTDYAFRARIALLGLGANTREEATYPTGITDGSGVLYDASRNYRLVFAKGQEPPARYFWSLTMYDTDGYLVPNEAGRYSLGPSHPPLLRQADGSIVIDIRHTRPADKTVNWLPAPASGGFRLNLRLYGPAASALQGRWAPPGVRDLGPSGLPAT